MFNFITNYQSVFQTDYYFAHPPSLNDSAPKLMACSKKFNQYLITSVLQNLEFQHLCVVFQCSFSFSLNLMNSIWQTPTFHNLLCMFSSWGAVKVPALPASLSPFFWCRRLNLIFVYRTQIVHQRAIRKTQFLIHLFCFLIVEFEQFFWYFKWFFFWKIFSKTFLSSIISCCYWWSWINVNHVVFCVLLQVIAYIVLFSLQYFNGSF